MLFFDPMPGTWFVFADLTSVSVSFDCVGLYMLYKKTLKSDQSSVHCSSKSWTNG